MKSALWIIGVGIIAAGIIFLAKGDSSSSSKPQAASIDNVKIIDGVQIIEITAKGGYKPRRTEAEAGLPTILRFQTNGTFDCSLSLRIPSENVSKFLPQSGTTDIDIGKQQAGTLSGTCSMGMYRFSINFK